ncbi:hypothetical protein CRUP_003678 [Coryphaenoides rupestris]|nr:hypothetical protein CRUP_003678 [Coryphaenoides rupestris]
MCPACGGGVGLDGGDIHQKGWCCSSSSSLTADDSGGRSARLRGPPKRKRSTSVGGQDSRKVLWSSAGVCRQTGPGIGPALRLLAGWLGWTGLETSSPVQPSQPASPLSAEDHKTFRESWPPTDLETTLPSNMDPPAPSNVSAQWRHQQDSLLAKYVERFRFGGPRSRAERPRCHDITALTEAPAPDSELLDVSASVDQLSSASTTVGTTSSSSFSRPHPENDILFQWRLRRKMEQARQRPWVLSEQPPALQGPQTLSGQPPGLQRPRTPGRTASWSPGALGPLRTDSCSPGAPGPLRTASWSFSGPRPSQDTLLVSRGPSPLRTASVSRGRALSEQPPHLQWPQTLSGHSPDLQGPWALSEQPPGLQGPQSVWQSPGLQQPSVHQKRIQEPETIVFPISKLGSKEMPKLCPPAAGTTPTPLPHPGPRQTVSRPQVAMVPLLNDVSSPPTQQKAVVPPKHSKAVSESAAERSLEAGVGEPEACPSAGSAQEQRSRETNRPAEDKSSNRKQKTRSTRCDIVWSFVRHNNTSHVPLQAGPGGHTVSASPHSPGEVLAPAPHKLSHNKDQRQMNSQALNQEVCSAPSPVHQAVLFPQGFSTRGCSLPAPAPPPSLGAGRQKAMEVVSQLLWEAEDSDGDEFENDVLLQVLRNQRLWVQEQLSQVDSLLKKLQREGEVGAT